MPKVASARKACDKGPSPYLKGPKPCRKNKALNWESFQKDGCLIARVLPEEEMSEWRDKFIRHVTTGPELKPDLPESLTFFDNRKGHEVDRTVQIGASLGSFAAISTPSANMGPLMDDFRKRANAVIIPMIRAQFPEFKYVRTKWDRAAYRVKGSKVAGKGVRSAHRDLPKVDVEGIQWGGFLNTGTTDQYFTLVPHTFVQGKSGGFKPADCKKEDLCTYVVKPGCVIAFPATGVHIVMGSTGEVCRLFMGWDSTNDPKTIYDHMGVDIESLLASGTCPPLPSGQACRVYAKNHRACYGNLVKAFYEKFISCDFGGVQGFYQACGKDASFPALATLGLPVRPSENMYA